MIATINIKSLLKSDLIFSQICELLFRVLLHNNLTRAWSIVALNLHGGLSVVVALVLKDSSERFLKCFRAFLMPHLTLLVELKSFLFVFWVMSFQKFFFFSLINFGFFLHYFDIFDYLAFKNVDTP